MRTLVLLSMVILSMTASGCGDDDKVLVKWRCTGNCEESYACAPNLGEAMAVGRCTGSSYGPASCRSTGDICACAEGASNCSIINP